MNDFFTILSPSYLLFPALVGTLIMGLVCPLIGSYLVLRRTIFLGLTLPEIAAAGVSFTFWLQQTGILPQFAEGERSIGMIGSLVFTFLGMGLLGYLEQRGKGLAEGRLAAAYAFAGALTILFMVFNPAGQIEVLNLLKGEVIALSRGELKLLAIVFGLVFLAMLVFRREFLLISFDRDLGLSLERAADHLGHSALSPCRSDHRSRRHYGGAAVDFWISGAAGARGQAVGQSHELVFYCCLPCSA